MHFSRKFAINGEYAKEERMVIHSGRDSNYNYILCSNRDNNFMYSINSLCFS